MKVLYATTNMGKLEAMKARLKELPMEIISLKEVCLDGTALPAVLENGKTPLENAKSKARTYFDAFHMPVFSCDNGLYFENVPTHLQPGVHVRRVNGRSLSDAEMISYYAGLATQYGDLVARYVHAICLIVNENQSYASMDRMLESERFLLTAKPHSRVRKQGFPLDSMSIEMESGRYYYDLSKERLDQLAVSDGFLCFFEHILQDLEKTNGL